MTADFIAKIVAKIIAEFRSIPVKFHRLPVKSRSMANPQTVENKKKEPATVVVTGFSIWWR